MTSQSIPNEIQIINPYDDKSLIKEEHTPYGPDDLTRAPVFPADNNRGTSFEPFHVETRNFHINILPSTPLQLFHLFLSIFTR